MRWVVLVLALGCVHEPELVAKPGPVAPAATACERVPRSEQLPSSGTRDYAAAQAQFEAASSALERGAQASAMDALSDAIRLDPTHAFAHLAKAELHLTWDGDEAMLAHAATASALRPSNPRAHAVLSTALAEAQRPEDAITHARCALLLRPGYSKARRRLAILLIDTGRLDEARRELERLHADGDGDLQSRMLLASANERDGRFRQAAELVEREARAGRNPVLLRRAAQLWRRADDPDRAEELRAIADAIDPPPEDRSMRELRPSRR